MENVVEQVADKWFHDSCDVFDKDRSGTETIPHTHTLHGRGACLVLKKSMSGQCQSKEKIIKVHEI